MGGFSCKGKCENMPNILRCHRNMYTKGGIWCKQCEVSIPKEQAKGYYFCPCCGCRMRLSPNRISSRERAKLYVRY